MSAPRVFFYSSDQDWLERNLTASDLCGWCNGTKMLPGLNNSAANKVGPPHCWHCDDGFVLPVPESIVVPEQIHEGDVVWIVATRSSEMIDGSVDPWTGWYSPSIVLQPSVVARSRVVAVEFNYQNDEWIRDRGDGWRVELAPLVPCEPLTEIECPDCKGFGLGGVVRCGKCRGTGKIPIPALAAGEVKAL